ncbi:MAG: TonB family protein [Dysgonomonas sp.]
MKNLINLNSSEWCDIVFEGKNKSYGAYEMRQSSTKRHLIAFGAMLLLVAIIAALPSIVSTVKAATTGPNEGYDGEYTMATIVDITPPIEEPKIPDMVVPEPPKLIAAEMRFVPPTIVEDELVDPDKTLTSMEDLTKSKITIGKHQILDGSLDKEAVRLDDIREFEKVVEPVKEKGPVTIAEVMPQFPGGEKEMYSYINNNLRYPTVAQENGTQGKVTIRFVVGKSGEILDAQILKGFDIACDKEALRVVKSMPRWIPGKQNGVPVQVYFTLPITFRLKI